MTKAKGGSGARKRPLSAGMLAMLRASIEAAPKREATELMKLLSQVERQREYPVKAADHIESVIIKAYRDWIGESV